MVLTLLGWLPGLRKSLPLEEDVVSIMFAIGVAIAIGVGQLGATSALHLWISSRGRRRRAERATPPDPTIGLVSFEEISAWVTDDSAVERASEDAFGHARIAARIASRLCEAKPPAQAVVGRLGAGKTTLRHLVVEALGVEPGGERVRLVPVELWPYETPRAAVAGVIGGLVEALAREVNVLSLRGVPSAYAEAMSAAGGIWSALVRLQGIPSDPFESLRQIDRLAKTIGLQYVVWIEDLERFGGGQPEKPDEERLSPIRALLYGLDQLDSITVITATTTLHARFDIEKIARYVEHLPELSEDRVRKIFGLFRTGLSTSYAFIDPASPTVRKKLGELGNDIDMKMLRALVGPDVHNVGDALPALCNAPSAQKSLEGMPRHVAPTWR